MYYYYYMTTRKLWRLGLVIIREAQLLFVLSFFFQVVRTTMPGRSSESKFRALSGLLQDARLEHESLPGMRYSCFPSSKSVTLFVMHCAPAFH